MITRAEFWQVVDQLSAPGEYAFDTETTGLRAYHDDQLFSVIIADANREYYFNFQPYPEHGYPEGHECVLPREWLSGLRAVFGNEKSTFAAHNAKFDLAMLAREGIEVRGEIHCTLAMARVVYNEHMLYGLSACAERIGLKKDDGVEKYIKQHKLYTSEQIPGKKVKSRRPYYFKVPPEIIVPYGKHDARVCFALAQSQKAKLEELDEKGKSATRPSVLGVVSIEKRLTPVLHRMERTGIKLDLDFCKRAAAHERARADAAVVHFKEASGGREFLASAKLFEEVFAGEMGRWRYTEKGNPSFESDTLSLFRHPAAKAVLKYRDAKSRSDFYEGFLYHADKDGVIHPQLNQGGTGTGRMSSSDPNFQNVTAEEDVTPEFVVRRAVVPRPGFYLAALDYKAMEFRAMLDYAGEVTLANQVRDGLDPHQATADLVGISRKQAKTLNFGLLYGMGAQKLGDQLGVSLDEARALKRKYFSALPRVQALIQGVAQTAEHRGYIFNRFGRICHFPDKRFAYKATNYLIQGSCADAMKLAMVEVDAYLRGRGFKSQLLLQVHDEILLEIREGENTVLHAVKAIMEKAYPHRLLPMEVSVEFSRRSWADMEPVTLGGDVQAPNPEPMHRLVARA